MLHTQRDTLLWQVDIENQCFNAVTDSDDLLRMLDLLGPAHFGNVNEAFDALRSGELARTVVEP